MFGIETASRAQFIEVRKLPEGTQIEDLAGLLPCLVSQLAPLAKLITPHP